MKLFIVGCILGFSVWVYTVVSKPSPGVPLFPITLQLKWQHSSQFAGFYAADYTGEYRAEGLEVTFLEGGPDIDPRTSIRNKTAQFSTIGADQLILARADHAPLRAIATIYRRSPVVFMTLADSGITRLEEVRGKSVRVPPQHVPTFRAAMARLGITPEQYTEINEEDLALFYNRKVPIWVTYITADAFTAQEAGYRLHLLYPDDYGVHFYGDTLVTTEAFIEANSEIISRFLRATLKGWLYILENLEAVEPLLPQYIPEANPVRELALLTLSLPLINTGEDRIGWMKPEVWRGMVQVLYTQGSLTTRIEEHQLYTLRFLQEIYGHNLESPGF